MESERSQAHIPLHSQCLKYNFEIQVSVKKKRCSCVKIDFIVLNNIIIFLKVRPHSIHITHNIKFKTIEN